MIIHAESACRLSHASGSALVLHHVGIAFNRGDAALHPESELIRADLRFGELGSNVGFNLLRP